MIYHVKFNTQKSNSRQQQKQTNDERKYKNSIFVVFLRECKDTHTHTFETVLLFFLACNWYLIAHNK